MNDSFSFDIEVNDPLPQAIEKLTLALKEVGFGVLTRIDVHDVLKAKINVDFQPYTILGVCNPHLAHKALAHNSQVGMMLPCPITLEEKNESTTMIKIGNPDAFIRMAGFADDPVLAQVAEDANRKLGKAVLALQSTTAASTG